MKTPTQSEERKMKKIILFALGIGSWIACLESIALSEITLAWAMGVSSIVSLGLTGFIYLYNE